MRRTYFLIVLILLTFAGFSQKDQLISNTSLSKQRSAAATYLAFPFSASTDSLPKALPNASIVDKIVNALDTIASRYMHTQLFLHIDKTIYDHGENVWLAGYVLRSPYGLADHHTLYVALLHKQTRKIISSDEFIMLEGKSAGYIFLPDSLGAGDYTIMAYTNKKGNEKHGNPFIQDITIRPFKDLYTLNITESKETLKGDSVILNAIVKDENNKYPIGQVVSYKLKSGKETLASGDSYVKMNGDLELPPFPASAFGSKEPQFTIEIKKDKKPFSVTKPIPSPKKIVKVRWYPESGKLVSGIPSTMAYEARDVNGTGIALKGKLLEDDVAISGIQTNASGGGTISFTPYAGKKYTLQWDNSPGFIDDALPLVASAGYTISVGKGVVKDSVRVLINTTTPGNCYLLIHDYHDVHELLKLSLKNNRTVTKLDAQKWNNGLATITLFDSTGKPVAERTVFKEAAQNVSASIKTDSSLYGNRSKVSLTIKLTDKKGKPVQASLSLACVLKNRIDSARYQGILPYLHYNGYAGSNKDAVPPHYRMASSAETEMMLLTRYWTNYKWDSLVADREVHPPHTELGIRGIVKYKNRKLKKPTSLILMNGLNIVSIDTDSTGYFTVLPDMIASEPHAKMNLVVNEKWKEDYTISLFNTNDSLQPYYANASYPVMLNMIKEEKVMIQEDALLNAVKTLAAVTVKSKSFNSFGVGTYKSRNCKDYVCMNNILNCRNHLSGTKPQNGMAYSARSASGKLESVIYSGCDEEGTKDNAIMYQFKGRYYTKEFYVADYEKHNPAEAEKLTTVYWNPEVITNDLGEATISFYTNDLQGIFSCIIQGNSYAGVVFGKTEFSVLKRD